jgi:hypothetical protein
VKKTKQKNGMCTYCFNNQDTEFICSVCNITFIDTHNSYNDLNLSICKMCRSSNNIKKKYLHNYVNNNTINLMLDINQNKKIKIDFDVYDENHDGYCSDSGDTSTEIYIKSQVFPLMNDFNPHPDDSNTDLTLNEKFKYFYTPESENKCGMGCTKKKYTINNYLIS